MDRKMMQGKKRRKIRFHDTEEMGEKEKIKRNCVFLSLKV